METGKSQAFDGVLREFIFQVIIQPVHLLMYIVLIGAASDLANANILYTIMCFVVFFKSEDFIKGLFGIKPQFGSPLSNLMKYGAIKGAARGAKNFVKKGINNSKEKTKDRFKTLKDKTKEQMDLARNEDGTFDKGARRKALLTGINETARANAAKNSRMIKAARGTAEYFGVSDRGDKAFGKDENSRSEAAKKLKKINGKAATSSEISTYLEEEEMLKRNGFKDAEIDDVHEVYIKSGKTADSLDKMKRAKKTYRKYSGKDYDDSKKMKEAYDNRFNYYKSKEGGSKSDKEAHRMAIEDIHTAHRMNGGEGKPNLSAIQNKSIEYADKRFVTDGEEVAGMLGIDSAEMDKEENKQKINDTLEAECDFINDDSNRTRAKNKLKLKGMVGSDEAVTQELQKEFRYKNNKAVRDKALANGIREEDLDAVLDEQYEYLSANGAELTTLGSIDTDSKANKALEAEFLISKTDTKNRDRVRAQLTLEGKDSSDSSVEARMQEIAHRTEKIDDGKGGIMLDPGKFAGELETQYLTEMKKSSSKFVKAEDAEARLEFVLDDKESNNLSRTKVTARMKEVTGKAPTQEEITLEMSRVYDVAQRVDRKAIEDRIKATAKIPTGSDLSREVDKVICDASVYFDASTASTPTGNSMATEVMLDVKEIENKVASNHNDRQAGVHVATIASKQIKANKGKSRKELKQSRAVQSDILRNQIKGALGSRYSGHEATEMANRTLDISEKGAKK